MQGLLGIGQSAGTDRNGDENLGRVGRVATAPWGIESDDAPAAEGWHVQRIAGEQAGSEDFEVDHGTVAGGHHERDSRARGIPHDPSVPPRQPGDTIDDRSDGDRVGRALGQHIDVLLYDVREVQPLGVRSDTVGGGTASGVVHSMIGLSGETARPSTVRLTEPLRSSSTVTET